MDEEVVSLFFYDENEMMWKCSFPFVCLFFFLVSFRDHVTKLVLFSRAETEEEILYSAYAVDCGVQCSAVCMGCAGLAYGNDHPIS